MSKERKALNVLKHLPGYATIFGIHRSKLVDGILRWVIAPSTEDDSRKAQRKRSFIAGYRLDALSREATPYYNKQPFISMIQQAVTFDRLLEFSVGLEIDPFEELPKDINGLTVGTWGNWIGGLRWPEKHVQDAIDRWFVAHLDHRHNVFVNTPDYSLIKLGYLTDSHKSQMEVNHWRGDRSRVGGDHTLRLTNLAASFPLFLYTKKGIRFFGDTPEYVIELQKSKGEKQKKKSLEQRYIRRCYYWGRERYRRLALVRQMAKKMETVDKWREHIQAEFY